MLLPPEPMARRRVHLTNIFDDRWSSRGTRCHLPSAGRRRATAGLIACRTVAFRSRRDGCSGRRRIGDFNDLLGLVEIFLASATDPLYREPVGSTLPTGAFRSLSTADTRPPSPAEPAGLFEVMTLPSRRRTIPLWQASNAPDLP